MRAFLQAHNCALDGLGRRAIGFAHQRLGQQGHLRLVLHHLHRVLRASTGQGLHRRKRSKLLETIGLLV